MENPNKAPTEQPNMKDHDKNEFQAIVNDALTNGGLHICASKGHGKTRLLFSIAKYLQSLPNCRVIAFDGSEAWLYNYSKIAVFTVNERDIQLVNEANISNIEEIEKYALTNWQFVKLALESNKDVLFRLKTRKPSKRGFFVRSVINYLDAIQRQQKQETANHEAKQKIAYMLEEAQDSFNVRSTMKADSEEFMTVFNEARNESEAFFTASQRLTDFSKTIRTKQNYCLGKINFEDKQGLLRIEKQYGIDFSKMAQKTWFVNGKTFESPIWTQQGKPYIINRQIRATWFESMASEQPQQKNFWQKHPMAAFFLYPIYVAQQKKKANQRQQPRTQTQTEKNIKEDSEGDGLMTLPPDEILFPAEDE